VQKVIKTVSNNLIEGGLIVIFVLVLLLGNFRAGIIVASVIPLSMLFAFSMMYLFGVTATVMSLGAIDFGLIVDGTVIIVEGIIHHLQKTNSLQKFSQKDMDKAVLTSSLRIRKSASFGAIIILIVYFPILSLQGIEGKMFRPMALTVSFAIIGALILSFTYVPMLSSLFLSKKSSSKTTFADRIMDFLYRTYKPVFLFALRNKLLILGTSALVMLGAVFVYNRLGAVFIPTLDEGNLAMQMTIPPGSSLDESINASTKAEKVLLKNFPEVKHVVSKIGTAEVPTDPMAIEDADIMIILKDRKEWSSAETRYELVNRMKEKLSVITGASFEFTQPIQLRFNELLTGAKSDVVVKIYGEELDILFEKANMAARIISQVQGAADIKVEQIEGLPQMVINYKREQIARYGLNIEDLNTIVRTALSGEKAGVFFEGEKKFDIVVRLQDRYRKDTEQIKNLFIRTPTGLQIPLGEVATIDFIEGPMQISRDGTQRRISIGINVRNRDVESLVNEIQDKLETEFKLPPGYYVTYGGQFENLQSAMARLKIVVPIALAMIFILLYFAFGSLRQALIIFTTIPLSAIGGVISLWIRGMPFSISAGVGFIALFGVAVLDGIVLINYMNELKSSGVKNLHRRLILGTKARLRPVTVTSAVASLGFLPMAVSTTAGAEVQRPLATVVIGGIITSTLLTMVAMPLVYYYFEKISRIKIKPVITLLILFFTGLSLTSQAQQSDSVKQLTLHESVDYALDGHPLLHNASLRVQQAGINRKTAMNFGKTEFSIQHGQINSELTDDYISVKQNLGSPLEFLTLSKYHKEQQDVEQAKQKLIANEIKRNVTAKYFEILWLKNKLQILRDNFILYEDFLRFANLKYEIGESNYLSKLVAENTKEELENRIYQIESMIKTSEKSFNQVICSDEYYSTENIPVFRITPGIFRDTSMTGCEICYNVYKEQLDVAEKEISVKRSALSPELYVGYFTQKIDKVSGFNGIEGGLQIPLLFFSQHAAIKSAKIGFQIAKNELEYKRMFMFTEREKLREKLERLNSTLEVKKRAADRAGKIIETANKLYQNQEIEYFEFVRNTSDAIDVKLKYLDLMNTYNQTFIELKYLTF
jgi:heavy metal efflux system protein